MSNAELVGWLRVLHDGTGIDARRLAADADQLDAMLSQVENLYASTSPTSLAEPLLFAAAQALRWRRRNLDVEPVSDKRPTWPPPAMPLREFVDSEGAS